MTSLLVRRGTTALRTAVTPANGEPAWDTEQKKFYVGDGTTAGGVLIGPTGAGAKVTLTDAATITIDGSLGTAFEVTIAGNNRTINATNLKAGDRYTIDVIQDAAGDRHVTWDATIHSVPLCNAFPTFVHSILLYSPDGTNLVYLADHQDDRDAPFDPSNLADILGLWNPNDNTQVALTGDEIDAIGSNVVGVPDMTSYLVPAGKARLVATDIGNVADVTGLGDHIGFSAYDTGSANLKGMIVLWRIPELTYNQSAFIRTFWAVPNIAVFRDRSDWRTFANPSNFKGVTDMYPINTGDAYDLTQWRAHYFTNGNAAGVAENAEFRLGYHGTNGRDGSAQMALAVLYNRELTLSEQNLARAYWAKTKGLTL